jgi:hypothetical protein
LAFRRREQAAEVCIEAFGDLLDAEGFGDLLSAFEGVGTRCGLEREENLQVRSSRLVRLHFERADCQHDTVGVLFVHGARVNEQERIGVLCLHREQIVVLWVASVERFDEASERTASGGGQLQVIQAQMRVVAEQVGVAQRFACGVGQIVELWRELGAVQRAVAQRTPKLQRPS